MEIRSWDSDFTLILRGLRAPVARAVQVALVLDAVRLPTAQPVTRRGQNPSRSGPRVPDQQLPRDDLRVCPPQLPGQLALCAPRRTLTREHAQRIADRSFPEMAPLQAAIARRHAGRGLSSSWPAQVLAMARLALAARDPADHLVAEADLAQLPNMRAPLRELLGEVGLLRADNTHAAAPRRPRRPARSREPGSCEHCLAWSGTAARLCQACKRAAQIHPVGPCQRCRYLRPLSARRCRFCRVTELELSLDDDFTAGQLWFGSRVGVQANLPGRDVDGARARRARHARQAALVVSEHMVDPAQPELFPAPTRQWQHLTRPDLLALTPQAQSLVDDFAATAREQAWTPTVRKAGLRTLRLVAGHLGARAPLREQDLRAAARLSSHHSALRVIWFLQAKDLLVPDPHHQIDRHAAAIDRSRATVPEQFRADFDIWTTVLRGHGRRPSPALPSATIRAYAAALAPLLVGWQQVSTTAEITHQQVRDATAHSRALTAVKSFFKALKRERRIFRDPARTVQNTITYPLPRPIPPPRLAGLLDHVPSVADKVVVVLIAVHAVRPKQISRLLLTDLDRAAGRLHVRGSGAGRVVYLDEHTLLLLKNMLSERHRRWPLSFNPHLVINATSAMHPDGPPVGYTNFDAIYERIGLNATQLRRDRILDEALATADPVHLMRLFGISTNTALTYLRVAYPDHFAIDPTEA